MTNPVIEAVYEQRSLKILSDLGAVITDNHFVYTSGLHGRVYVNKDVIYPRTELTSDLCEYLAGLFCDQNDIDVVVVPAIGGIVLSQWSAYHLSNMQGREVRAVYAEREEESLLKVEQHPVCTAVGMRGRLLQPGEEIVVKKANFQLKRGYAELVKGKRVRVIEDILTTGSTVLKVVEAVRAAGGHVESVGALCNRGGVTAEKLGVPLLRSLVNLNVETWTEEECRRSGPCSEHVPVHPMIGKGAAFLARRQAA